MKFLEKQTKYLFYILVIILVPQCYYCYFLRKGQSPFEDVSLALKMFSTLFVCIMAYWSHAEASGPNDPGYVEKYHFRKVDEFKGL